MSKIRLKEFRVGAGMTQAKVAAEVGVKQPTYQRWESGGAPVPKAKLKKLAQVLGADPQALLGKHPPIEAGFYNRTVSRYLDYYGEVSVHFTSGAPPLLLSISWGEFSDLHADLQRDHPFVTVRSLANQTVMIRTKAIADLYFCSEAYDNYGPEHDSYTNHLAIQMPDPRDWEIVECIEFGDEDEDDFDPADIERVAKRILITDEQYKEALNEGLITFEELGEKRAEDMKETNLIFSAANQMIYQLSSGPQRQVSCGVIEKELYQAFSSLIDMELFDFDSDMIQLKTDSSHRIIFINKNSLDYVVIPTHKYEAGRVELQGEELDFVLPEN